MVTGVRDSVKFDRIAMIVVVVVELSIDSVTFGGTRTFSIEEVLPLIVVLSCGKEDVSLILMIFNGVVVELVELFKDESGEELSPKTSPSNG